VRRVVQYLGYVAARVAIAVVQAVPLSVCQTFADAIAILAVDVLRVRWKVIDENLRHAYPTWTDARRKRLAREMWAHLFMLLAEIAHAPRKIHETNWRDYFQLSGARELINCLLDDRPLLVVSAHYGNFELAGVVLGLLGFPTYAVARTLDNPFLDRWVNEFRGSTGQHIVPKKGGYDDILRILGRGGTMTFLADQYAGTKGCWVDFFGRPASAHKAIALFALEHDAVISVGTARRLGAPLKYELVAQSFADPRANTPNVAGIRELTAWYTSEIERFVRVAPSQYWWLHRRWKDHRPARRRRAA
jgi:KDO2-lipid IV(A) lauroyltransferase